jgi:tRNA A-37 threonylcarbamoyl transferase component Bud32
MWVAVDDWQDDWWAQMAALLEDMPNVVRASRHARTAPLTLSAAGQERHAFFKLYRSSRWTARLKDLFRISRARRALEMSYLLAQAGFGVPLVLAAGEERRRGIGRRGFLLTAAVAGVGLHEVPAALSGCDASERRRLKRSLLAAVGAEVGRFHALGYLHGDLVVTNVMVRWQPYVQVWFLDHDRTRQIGVALRRWRQRRNLVHLNRHRVRGVNHADRLRLLCSYARTRGWTRARLRQEARWIARKTMKVRSKE